jgi:hypothetical protein
MRQARYAWETLVVELGGERPLGKLGRKWEDNIRIVLREIGWEGVDWIHLAQDRKKRRALVNTVMNLWVS